MDLWGAAKMTTLPRTAIREGDPVYVRAYSTHRAAVAELVTLRREAGRDWGQVRLVTEWHEWDEEAASAEALHHAGEVLQVEAFRLEAIRC
jgi:hypothetical protein